MTVVDVLLVLFQILFVMLLVVRDILQKIRIKELEDETKEIK